MGQRWGRGCLAPGSWPGTQSQRVGDTLSVLGWKDVPKGVCAGPWRGIWGGWPSRGGPKRCGAEGMSPSPSAPSPHSCHGWEKPDGPCSRHRAVTKPPAEAALGSEPAGLHNTGDRACAEPPLARPRRLRGRGMAGGGGGRRVSGCCGETAEQPVGSHRPPCRGGCWLMAAGS